MRFCIILHLISYAFANEPPDPVDPLEAQLKKVHKRPPTDAKGRLIPIDYTVKITSTFLNSLDTASLTLWVWLVEQYSNPSLGWNLDEFPQHAIPVSPEVIYMPELRSCAGGKLDRTLPSEIQVDHNGLVTIRSEAFLTTICRPSYDRYPYDRNNCTICFETQRAGAPATLTVDLKDCFLKGTPEVRLEGEITVNEWYTYEEGGMSVAEVKMSIILQRNPTVIMLMIFLPALLLYIEIFLVMRYPNVEEFKMLLEGTSVYATLNLAIVEVLARTNSLPGLGKYTSGSQVILLLLSLTFVAIRAWGKRERLKKYIRPGDSRWCTKWRYLCSSMELTPQLPDWFHNAVEKHGEAVLLAIVSIVALAAPAALSYYSFK